MRNRTRVRIKYSIYGDIVADDDPNERYTRKCKSLRLLRILLPLYLSQPITTSDINKSLSCLPLIELPFKESFLSLGFGKTPFRFISHRVSLSLGEAFPDVPLCTLGRSHLRPKERSLFISSFHEQCLLSFICPGEEDTKESDRRVSKSASMSWDTSSPSISGEIPSSFLSTRAQSDCPSLSTGCTWPAFEGIFFCDRQSDI